MKINRFKRSVSIFVIIITFLLLFHYLRNDFNKFKDIHIFTFIPFVYLFILATISLINNGLLLKYIIKPFNLKLNPKEWFGLSVLTTLGNYITPFSGGAIFRATYLKKKYNFPYSSFISTLGGIYLIAFLMSSIVGLISIIFFSFLYGESNLYLTILFTFLVTFLISMLLIPFRFNNTNNNFLNKFIKILNGWNKIRESRIIKPIILLNLINLIILALMIFFEFKIFGVKITFLQALFLSVTSNISVLIGITPSSLGIRETLVAFSANIIGIPIHQSLIVVLLDRAIFLIIISILGPLFIYLLFRKTSIKLNDNN